jgi:hypothetical protein
VILPSDGESLTVELTSLYTVDEILLLGTACIVQVLGRDIIDINTELCGKGIGMSLKPIRVVLVVVVGISVWIQTSLEGIRGVPFTVTDSVGFSGTTITDSVSVQNFMEGFVEDMVVRIETCLLEVGCFPNL